MERAPRNSMAYLMCARVRVMLRAYADVQDAPGGVLHTKGCAHDVQPFYFLLERMDLYVMR